MKKLFLILFVLLISKNSYSEENFDRKWKTTFKNKEFITFLDLNSVKSGGMAIISYISLVSYNKPRELNSGEKYSAMQTYIKAQCTQPRKFYVYIYQLYDEKMDDADVMKGNIVGTLTVGEDDRKWITETLNSPRTRELDAACLQFEKQSKEASKEFREFLKKGGREMIEEMHKNKLKNK